MKLCPKCQSFFDDELLKFCLNDGTPLAIIDQTNHYWQSGVNSIRQKRKSIQQEEQKQRFKKIISILIMMILVIMIFSVIMLRSWIYLNKPEPETTNKVNPNPTAEVSPTPTPEILIAGLVTPTPTPMATPIPKITVTPTLSPSPEISPTIKISPTPCNKRSDENFLRQTRYEGFLSDANNTRNSSVKYFIEKNQIPEERVSVYNNFSPDKMKITVSSCEKATVTNSFSWFLNMDYVVQLKFKEYKINLQYDCTKIKGTWGCSIL